MAGRVWDTFEAIGNFVIPYWFLHGVDNVLNGFRTSRLYRFLHPGKESWALVTGASDGIGEGLAHELAERGFNVILHGRNPDKLKKKEALVKDAYPHVKTRIWIADSTANISSEEVLDAVKGIHLTLLINNVGGLPPGHDEYSALEHQPFEHIDRTIAMNIGFGTKLEAALLPTLIENQPSGIINVSSLGTLGKYKGPAGFPADIQAGAPFVSVYAGTKAYLNAHSMSVQAELTGTHKDVTVHSMIVGKVISASLLAKPGFAIPTSRTMAKAILDNIGLGGCVMIPYLPHLLQNSFVNILPAPIARRLIFDAMIKSIETTRSEKAKLS